MTQYRRYRFEDRKFVSAFELSKYIAGKLGIPKSTPTSWQAIEGIFTVRKNGEIIFQRSFTHNGVENILREDVDA